MFIPRTIVRRAAIVGLLAALIVIVALVLGASGPDLMRLPGEQAVLSVDAPLPAAHR